VRQARKSIQRKSSIRRRKERKREEGEEEGEKKIE
jgi:hypothetical protein